MLRCNIFRCVLPSFLCLFYIYHYSDVTCPSWCRGVRLFDEQFVQTNNKAHTKAPHCWPLCEGNHQWHVGSTHRRPVTWKRFRVMTPSWFGKMCRRTIYTLRPRQNGRHFADDIFKRIFFNEKGWISIKISLKFVPKAPINNIPALVQIMAWRRVGDKPLSEPMMVRSPTHICVTRPQWVNMLLPGVWCLLLTTYPLYLDPRLTKLWVGLYVWYTGEQLPFTYYVCIYVDGILL